MYHCSLEKAAGKDVALGPSKEPDERGSEWEVGTTR